MDIPQHHRQAVIPHIMVEGATKALDFYRAAFDAVELFRLGGEDGRIAHAEVSIAGSTLMLSDGDQPPFAAPGATTPVALHVYVPDVDDTAAQAAAAGAEVLSPAADMAYGLRQATLRDPFGHVWILLSPLQAPSLQAPTSPAA